MFAVAAGRFRFHRNDVCPKADIHAKTTLTHLNQANFRNSRKGRPSVSGGLSSVSLYLARAVSAAKLPESDDAPVDPVGARTCVFALEKQRRERISLVSGR
jgi:hypothetical protein